MKALTYIELDLDYCSLTYGVAPCAATLTGDTPTGTIKCFNTISTCQDRDNFTNVPVTVRFAMATSYRPLDIEALPNLKSVDYSPAVISLGEDLGQRASLTATFADHPHSDTGPGGDKYLADRTYNPWGQGSFWGKFRARQSFVRGRPLRWKQGLVGQAIGDMDTRHFVMESFNGPNLQGQFTVTAKDVLKLLDGDRAQAPVLSKGQLSGAIDTDDTTATLAPPGVGSTYPASGWLAIGGKEIVAFARDPDAGNDANTKLLLHFDGADAATAFADASASARTATAVGNAQLDTAKSVFGGAALLLDGTGDYVTLPDSTDWTFAGDFTIDCRAWFNSLSANRPLFSHSTDANNQYRLYATTAGALVFEVRSSSTAIVAMTSANGAVATGQWYHLAVVRQGNVWTIYRDGAAIATVTDTDAIPNFTSTFRIGADGGAANVMNGWIDEFRVSAAARWTADFTVPVAPYQASGDIVYITRAQFNTDAATHDAGDRCQLCLYYTAEDPADVVSDLASTYAGVDPSHIPLEAWQAETAAFYRRVVTAMICEPTPVNTLVSELVLQCGLAIWWDDIEEEIRLRVLRAIPTDAEQFDDSNVIQGTLQVAEQPDKRISQVWTYFGQLNPLKGVDDTDNFRSTAITVDLDAEEDYGQPAIKKIFSRWIPFGGLTIAERVNAIQLGRFRTAPRHFTFEVFRRGGETPAMGEGCRLQGQPMQDATGAREDVPIQIVSVRPRDDAFQVDAEEQLFVNLDEEDLGNRVIIIDANSLSLNLRSLHDSLFPALDEGDTVTFIVNANVIVGSSSTTVPAVDVGDWPDDFVPTLQLNGRIEGKGGDGGDAGYVTGTGDSSVSHGAAPGEDGGVALYTRTAIAVTYGADAEIWGGGGGGGGGSWRGDGTTASGGGGGGSLPGTAGGLPAGSGNTVTLGENGTTETGGSASLTGGDGGDPGEDGQDGTDDKESGGAGGTAGAAIDGVSFLSVTGTVDIAGATIN